MSLDLYAKDIHFVLELLQNAEDNSYPSGVVPEVRLILTENAILLQNNEMGFTEDNVRSLCDVANSNKTKCLGYIGEKGIGFKSVFRVTNEPYISSNGYSFSLPQDQKQKFLKGTGVSPAEFAERGGCSEEKKVFHLTPPLEHAQDWKGIHRKGLGLDLDQAIFLIVACYENSGINVNETLNNPNFIPHPATRNILDWFPRHGGDAPMKEGARLAKHLYSKWEANNKPKIEAVQRTLFHLETGEI